jgi:hypothetical protein
MTLGAIAALGLIIIDAIVVVSKFIEHTKNPVIFGFAFCKKPFTVISRHAGFVHQHNSNFFPFV